VTSRPSSEERWKVSQYESALTCDHARCSTWSFLPPDLERDRRQRLAERLRSPSTPPSVQPPARSQHVRRQVAVYTPTHSAASGSDKENAGSVGSEEASEAKSFGNHVSASTATSSRKRKIADVVVEARHEPREATSPPRVASAGSRNALSPPRAASAEPIVREDKGAQTEDQRVCFRSSPPTKSPPVDNAERPLGE